MAFDGHGKTSERLDRAVKSADPKSVETGAYAGFDADATYGQRHIVKTPNGEIRGELITPTVQSVGVKVAVYLSTGGNLFDGI